MRATLITWILASLTACSTSQAKPAPDASLTPDSGSQGGDGIPTTDAGRVAKGGMGGGSGSPSLEPTEQSPAGCGLSSAAFCDSFDPDPTAKRGRAGDLDAARWSAGRFPGQDFGSPTEACPIQAAPIPSCRTSLKKDNVYPDEDSLICDATSSRSAQLMMLVAAQNYGVISYRARQPFDFANRTGKIVFDVDAVTEGRLASWVSLDLTEDPITASNYAAEPKLGNERGPVPRNALTISFNADGCGDEHDASGKGTWNSVGYVLSYNDYKQTIVSTEHSDCFRTAWGALNHVEVEISQSRVAVSVSDASTDQGKTFPNQRKVSDLPLNLPFTRGYVHLTGHNHAVEKYCHSGSGFCSGTDQVAPVYHWDNVGFDGPALTHFREYEIPDALTPTMTRGHQALNTGYMLGDSASGNDGVFTCCPKKKLDPLRFQNVDVAGAMRAKLAFNAFYQLALVDKPYTKVNLRYRVNGGAWHDRPLSAAEAASQDQSQVDDANYQRNTGNFAQVVDLPVSELKPGDNTLDFVTLNTPSSFPSVLANIDLILETQ